MFCSPMVTDSDSLETRAVAGVARLERHEALDLLAQRGRLGLAVAPHHRRDDAGERLAEVVAVAPFLVLVVVLGLAAAVDQRALRLFGQLGERQRRVELHGAPHGVDRHAHPTQAPGAEIARPPPTGSVGDQLAG
jgi:hypothetical protein